MDRLEFILGIGFDTGNGYLSVTVCDRIPPAPGPWNCYNGVPQTSCDSGTYSLRVYPLTECPCPEWFLPVLPYIVECEGHGGLCGCAVLWWGCPLRVLGGALDCYPIAAWLVCYDGTSIDVSYELGLTGLGGLP